MRSSLLRTTAAATLGFALLGAPYAFAQATTTPTNQTDTQAAPTTPAQPAPDASNDGMAPPVNSAPPSEIAPAGDSAANTATGTMTVTGNMQPAGTLLGEDVKGADVVGPDGEDVASLSDVLVVPDDGRIIGAVLNVGGVLGVGGKDVLVSWDDITVGADGETLTIAMTSDQLDSMPAFQPLPKADEAATTEPTPAPATGTAAPAAPSQ